MTPDIGQLGVEVLLASRRWGRARSIVRRLTDSKAASKSDVAKARRAYNQANTDLERIVMSLERAIQEGGQSMPMGKLSKQQAPFPWKNLFGMVSEVAKAVENATVDPNNPPRPTIIDATPTDRK
jgi:hypothetical protein